jgi:hypothetical protein
MPRERDDQYADYIPFLNQDEMWPSATDKSVQQISEMAPQHAISAYHKLLRWDSSTKDSTLARALVARAVGEDPNTLYVTPQEPLDQRDTVVALASAYAGKWDDGIVQSAVLTAFDMAEHLEKNNIALVNKEG